MNNSSFDIVLTGELVEHTTFEAACAAIASMFKISTEQAQQLLQAAPKVVKTGVDLETAKKYQGSLEDLKELSQYISVDIGQKEMLNKIKDKSLDKSAKKKRTHSKSHGK